MEFVFLVFLFFLNGMFAMSEIALVSVRRGSLTVLAEQGDTRARAALKLKDNSTDFLSTVQVGITSIGILSGIFGQAALAEPLVKVLMSWGVSEKWSGGLATALVVMMITYVSIVLGELVPKRIGQMHALTVTRWTALPIGLLARLAHPFVLLLSGTTNALLGLLGQKNTGESEVTEDEIHAMLAEGSRTGVIEQGEHELLRNVFRLDTRHLPSLMTPRAEIVFLDRQQPDSVNLERLLSSPHSRYPVCDGDLDHVVGVIHAKRLLAHVLNGNQLDLGLELIPPSYVPETLTGMAVMDQFRSTGSQVMFVIDEYGEVEGLVTLQDVLDVVTGELGGPDLDDPVAFQRPDGSWLFDGLIPVSELQDKLKLTAIPDEERRRYHTLSGMMMWLLGRIPSTGDVAVWEGWRWEVVDIDGKRIDKVQVSRLPDATVNDEIT